VRETIADVANLLRLHAAGFEGFVFLIGPLAGGWPGHTHEFAVLWLLGVLANGYLFALNDLVDLPRDRQNPRRARSPLVSGRISTDAATVWAVGLPLAAATVVIAARWPVAAQLVLVSTLILAAWVNVYQKATGHPVLLDALFALTMAAPIPATALAVLGGFHTLPMIETVVLFLLALELNSIAGNLKDLAADSRVGFQTVAVRLGTTEAADGTVVASRVYARYCWTLHGAVAVAGCSAVLVAARGTPVAAAATSTAVAAAACWWGARDLRALLTRRRRPSRRGRERYFAAGFVLLLLPLFLRASIVPLLAGLAGLLLWELGFVAYWRWHWSHGPRQAVEVA
jgi:4-hydroxybenzoate polyprenyltransferase